MNLELPSLLNLVVSTLVFVIAAWYARRYLDEQGIDRGMTRGILVFALASIVSWGAGEVVDWIEGPQQTASQAVDLSRLAGAAGLARH